MSVMTLRRAMRPCATWANAFLLTAAAVLGVLIGLLGMHVFSAGSSHHAPAAVSDVPHHNATAAAPTALDGAVADPCSEDGCGGMDTMALMACVLALLVSLILAIRPARLAVVPHSFALPRSSPSVVEAPSVPPDLNVLSISRT